MSGGGQPAVPPPAPAAPPANTPEQAPTIAPQPSGVQPAQQALGAQQSSPAGQKTLIGQ